MLFIVSVLAVAIAAILAFVLIRNIGRLKGFVLVGGIMALAASWPIAADIFISLDRTDKSGATPASGTRGAQAKNLPNVYYLIIDAYGRADALKDYAGFDNTSFVADLNGLGFQTLGNARSNYMKTHMSIPSTLSMNYPFTPEGTTIRMLDDGHTA